MNLNLKALWSSQNHNWQRFRTPLLAITFVGVVSLIGKVILTPTETSRRSTPATFPRVVPLPGWQFVQRKPLARQTEAGPDRRANAKGEGYEYKQSNRSLDVEIRYVDALIGDIPTLTRHYTSIELTKTLLQQRQTRVGFHGLFVYQGRAYLSACINQQGGSTVTRRQFVQNQISYSTRPERLLPALLGPGSLYDKQCLLTQLSVPLKQTSPESSYRTLEKSWVSWYEWWKLNVAKS